MIIYKKIFNQHGFSASQGKILEIIGKNKTILEVGSSTGYMTKSLKQSGCIVDVVEVDKKAVNETQRYARKIISNSIEDPSVTSKTLDQYDFIVMADVIEHLVDPKQALKNLFKIASSKTKLLISTPNIAGWPMRKQLFFKGDFEYQESGLLDETHLHFFTVASLPKLLKENNWKVEDLIGTVVILPFIEKIKKMPLLGNFLANLLQRKISTKYKNLSYYHFVVIASKI